MKTEFEVVFEEIGGFVGEIIDGNNGKKKGKEIGSAIGKIFEQVINNFNCKSIESNRRNRS